MPTPQRDRHINKTQSDSTRRSHPDSGASDQLQKRRQPNKAGPNIDYLCWKFGVAPELLEAADDVDASLELRRWLTWDSKRPKIFAVLTERGIDYIIRGRIPFSKRLAFRSTLISVVGVVIHQAYTYRDSIMQMLGQ